MSEKQDNSELQGSDLLQELTSTDSCTDGYDAICETLKKVYGEQEGQYHRALIPYCLGGDSPLDGVEVYLCKQERAHWHYITYGFSDLFENENPDSELSGYGFELTFRLLKGEEDSAPDWPINFLQNLARYVFESGNPFDAGHHMDANSPIALEEDTELTAMGFGLDPVLGQIEDQLKILWDFFNHTILHQNKSTIYFDASNNFYKTLCMRCLNGTAISFQTLNKNNVHKSIKILNAIPGPLN